MAQQKGGLGRGLDALISGAATRLVADATQDPPAAEKSAALRAPIDVIQAGAWQPRRNFDAESIEELARSIRDHGILQPLLVRAGKDGYELIAGERRLRAARAAGLTEVPVQVLEADDRLASEIALIENLQREDLDPIEEAEGYAALAERFHLTQEQISERVGKARATVANAFRLLGLPQEIRDLVRNQSLSAGHAKVLLGLASDAERLAWGRRCAREEWSVRELERRMVRPRGLSRRNRVGKPVLPDAQWSAVLDRLREKLGTGIRLDPCRALPGGRTGKGRLILEYYSDDDLDRLLVLLGVSDEGL